MTHFIYRKVQSFLMLMTMTVFLSSLYLQYGIGLKPCPLCLMQRLCVFLLLIVMGLSLGTRKKAHCVSWMQVLVSIAGLYFSMRQLWLQWLPEGQVPACMPGLDVLIHYFPWQTVAKTLFLGTGDCAQSIEYFLGFSLAAWSAVYFSVMAITGVILAKRTQIR